MNGIVFLMKSITAFTLIPLFSTVEKFWKYKLDHVLFWLVTIGFHIYTRMGLIEMAGWGQFLLEIFIRNVLLAIIIYAHSEYLIPEFIQQKKYLTYLGGLVLCFGFYIIVKNTHDAYLTVFTHKSALAFWRYSFYNFSISLFYMAFALALLLSKEWFFQRERLRQMEVEKLNTELEYLKSQINPHFLFNSLNTIFFQIDKSNQHARDTLTKFSDMLRFQLYECNGHAITLEREVAYLRNYADLQRLRRDERYAIEFITEGDLTDRSLAPLLFIPLVENAFKHISHHNGGGNKVRISITAKPDAIQLTVTNTKTDKEPNNQHVGGIGIKNLVRRLELQYPDRHRFEIDNSKKEYVVRLTLNENV
jgi:two-component system, LytTR family, sensor kinase